MLELSSAVYYDAESLFTNIPLDRTIEKLVEKIFNEIGRETYNFGGVVFSKDSVTKALELCVRNSCFYSMERFRNQLTVTQWVHY